MYLVLGHLRPVVDDRVIRPEAVCLGHSVKERGRAVNQLSPGGEDLLAGKLSGHTW